MHCFSLNCRQFAGGLLALLLLASGFVASGIHEQRAAFTQRYGAAATQAKFEPWQNLIASLQHRAETEKLKQVNDFLNRVIRYGEDAAIWQNNDYWATPLESIGRSLGDCEDYAIAKYFTLRAVGVPDDKLRFIYVRALVVGPAGSANQAHMVLAYFPRPDVMPLILDNMDPEIKPANERPDLTPVFSFNMRGVFAGPDNRPSSSVDRLSRWKDLILRMQAEGFDF